MTTIIMSGVTALFLFVIGIHSGAIKSFVEMLGKLVFRIPIKERIEKSNIEGVRGMITSKENRKISSVSYLGITILFVSIVLVVMNLKIVSGEAVSQYITKITNVSHMTIKVYFTSTLFALISLGVSMIASQWKKGYEYRKAQKHQKILRDAEQLSERELLRVLRKKCK